MSNFALLATDPSGDIISSINYLLATQGQTTANANLANALVANATNGTITTSNDPDYLAYLYQYINVRYADSADGSVNFSTSPTNRLYYGVRNSSTTPASSNPTDYIWTQVAGGGFGTTNFLYYATNGGRQIQWYVGTAPPGSNFVITTDAQYIDLDVLSASLVNTTLQILYSNGQVFNRNTANVWSPTEVANIISTTANISAVRNNVVIAAIGQTISYNAAAQTWTTTTNPSPNLNANTFSFGTLISSSNNYYQPVSYVDTYANLVLAKSVTVVTSGANGANGANGVSALSITNVYDNGQNFVYDGNVWEPAALPNGTVRTTSTITVSRSNVTVGRIVRTLDYTANTVIVADGNITGTGQANTVGSYNYLTYYNNGSFTVNGNGAYVDMFMVGPGVTLVGQYGGTLYGGDGGEVKSYNSVFVPPGTYSVTVGTSEKANLDTKTAGFYPGTNSSITVNGINYTANTSLYANGYGAAGAGGAPAAYQPGVTPAAGGDGLPDPWGTITWLPNVGLASFLAANGVGALTGNTYNTGGIAYFGGAGGGLFTNNSISPRWTPGGLGGGGYFYLDGNGAATVYTTNFANLQVNPGVYGGGPAVPVFTAFGQTEAYAYGGDGVVFIRTDPNANVIIPQDSLWVLSTTSNLDINANSFSVGTIFSSNVSFNAPITFTDANGNITTSISATAINSGINGQNGSRGFVPLAYVLTNSNPTSYSDAQYTTAFAAPRSNVALPIGTGFTPVDGDTAQFLYPVTNVSVVKTFSPNTSPNWTTANGQVIDGNLIVTGTITSAQMNTNSLYALTIQSTSATTGSNTSPGFWLQANTGNARFGGGLNVGNSLVVGNTAVIGSNLTVGANANIGNNLIVGNTAVIGTNLTVGANANIGSNLIVGTNLTVGNSATIGSNLIVGNNANIGANLFVSGLITTGNLNNNTVNTTTITSNAVSFFTGFQDNADLLTFYPNTSLYSLTNTISVTTTVTNTKVLVSGQVLSVIVANTASVLDDFTSNIGIRMLDGSTGLVYILTNEEKLFTPGVVGNVIQGDHAYYETGIVLTLANVATYSFGVYGKVTGTANIFFTDTLNRRNAVSNLKR